jgi:hypothetical protein
MTSETGPTETQRRRRLRSTREGRHRDAGRVYLAELAAYIERRLGVEEVERAEWFGRKAQQRGLARIA